MSPRTIAALLGVALMALGCRDVPTNAGQGAEPASQRPPVEGGANSPSFAPTAQPSIRSLTEQPVVGELGMPLGSVVEIQAIVVAGSELRMKAYASSYLLRVTEVDGKPLTTAPVMEFSVPSFIGVKLAIDDFDLYEIKTGKKARKLDEAQIVELQKGYVGRKVRLVVYETGGYSGIPRNLPNDVLVWQDHGFAFTTSLVILAERS